MNQRYNQTYAAIYEVVKQIPEGKVATYGQVAELAGNRHLARVVGNALHHNPDPAIIPCHRVVNYKGELAAMYAFGGIEGQKQRLLQEGVQVVHYQVNLELYQWRNFLLCFS